MKRKNMLIHAGVLLAVFIAAIVVFSFFTNRDTENLTADMGSASFPQISFSYNGYSLNTLSGYAQEMDIPSMRDTISPVADNKINIVILPYDNTITRLDYSIYSMDGTKQRLTGSVEDPEEEVTITFPENQDFSEEQVLMLTLEVQGLGPVYYYTRVADVSGKNLVYCLDYVYDFHNSALEKNEDSAVATAIEPTGGENDTSYYNVNIHSNFTHVSWGNLKPDINGTIRWEITEMNNVYTSVRLEYLVDCVGEENETDEYKVKEFFRVRYHKSLKQMYLLDYERQMEQVVNPYQTVLGESGVNLGVADQDMTYLANEDGTIVSFVQADELWLYNAGQNQISRLFSFVPAEGSDLRDLVSDHEIRLLEMDNDGNTTFAVLGYMNRGVHEGEVGVAVYYYDRAVNAVTEKIFVPTDHSWGYAVYDMGSMLYYSSDLDSLYMMIDGVLYEYHTETLWTKTIREDLPDADGVIAGDGSRIAFRTPEEDDSTTKILLKNFITGNEVTIESEEGDIIVPLGFVGADFVYGSYREADAGKTEAGEEVTPYYRLDIKNDDGDTVKTYQEDGIWILDAELEDMVITLTRATREEDVYTETTEEYIMSNEEQEEKPISLQTYVTNLKNTQVRLVFANGIPSREPRLSDPQLILEDEPETVEFPDAGARKKYYAYGYGEMQGIFEQPGEAVRCADACDGVVTDQQQAYVWQRGYRDLSYEMEEESGLVERACEGLRSGETPFQILEALGSGEVLDLTGCTTDEVLYVVNQGFPVIAMTDEKTGVVLVGYDTENVIYADAGTGKRSSVSYEEMDAMTEGSGHTFVGKMK